MLDTTSTGAVKALEFHQLAEHAAAIHRLGQRAREDIVEIGRHLVEARDHVEHGAWLAWIEAEFNWSDQTARQFIHLFEQSRDPKFNKLLNSDLPLSALYQLAAPKTPPEVRAEIAERVEAGETLDTAAVVKAIQGKRRKKTPEPVVVTVNGADVHSNQSNAELTCARKRIEALGPPWQLQEPRGRERSYWIHEPDGWDGKCGPYSIRCPDLDVVHNQLDKIEKVTEVAKDVRVPKAAPNVADIALREFDSHVLRLLQITKGAKPERYANKTGVDGASLMTLADFLFAVGDAMQGAA